MAGQADDQVWQAAQADNRFLITQDLDFSDLRRYTPGTHEGLLMVRLAHPGRDALLGRIVTLFATENVAQWRGRRYGPQVAHQALSEFRRFGPAA